MNEFDRDIGQLHLIVRYCGRLQAAVKHFGDSYDAFCASTPYQDSCSLCLIQIGEAVHRLSDGFKEEHDEIKWHRIYGMRNHLVHGYEMFDAEIAWDAIKTDIAPLEKFCSDQLGDIS